MSPKRGGRAQRRQRRNLLVSVIVVLVVSLGSFVAVFAAGWSPRLGLDLAGGVSVVYTAEGQHVTQADLAETVNILNLRVNGLGVSGAQVQSTGKNQISVSIPGVTDAQQVLDQIGQTARMYFRPVQCFAYAQPVPKASKTKVLPPGVEAIPSCGSQYQLTATNLNINTNTGQAQNNVPPDPQYTSFPSTSVNKPNYEFSTVLLPGLTSSGTGGQRYVLGRTQMTGHAISSAQATQNQTGAWVVDYTLNGAANSALWDQVAQANFHQLVGIELDGVVYSAPIIQPNQASPTSFQGRGEISGSLTQQDAQNLAQAMNYGALPVTLKAATSETVSATLGHSALVAGLGAGIAGLILVLLYVLLYYRALGLVVISGLVLTAMVLWAIISALGHTTVAPSFDLAGITGLIVSIGITVDSYIVYFERLKDEARSGRSVRTSVDRGFKSAWRTVWAADFVSLLAAVVLYLVAVGNVKGFAFFLGLSTILDMAFTWFYTRPLVILLGQSEHLQGSGTFSIATGLGAGPQASAGAARGAPGRRGRRRWVMSDDVRGRGQDDGTSSLDEVDEEQIEELEDEVDTEELDEDELITLDDAARALLAKPRRGHGPLARLYRGETRFDFVGRRNIWFGISAAIIALGIVSIILRGGLNLGIEFKGGTEWQVAAPGITQTQALDALKGTGLVDPTVELLGSGSKQTLIVQSDINRLSQTQQQAVSNNVQKAMVSLTAAHAPPASSTTSTSAATTTSQAGTTTGSTSSTTTTTTTPPDKVSITTVGPTWGSSITSKAIQALIVFFIAVGIYISIRFEPKMALAAFIAMVHDVLIAVGIYSIFGFQVTPDTVVAILTILGYSLYDTVVVFDRVRDNTRGIGSSGRMTYPQIINLSMNQTLARSINTSMVAILPVLSVLLIGAQLLGAVTLQSYGLALFVGLLSGAYSSIFIASPVLCMLKEREDRWVSIADRLAKRGEGTGWYSAAEAAAIGQQINVAAAGQTGRGGGGAGGGQKGPAKRSGLIRPGSAAQSGGAGTAVLDQPGAPSSDAAGQGPATGPGRTQGGAQAPRPRKGKRKRRR